MFRNQRDALAQQVGFTLWIITLCFSFSAEAQTYLTIDAGAEETWLGGINDFGLTVGIALSETDSFCFLADRNGDLHPLPIDIPDADFIWPSGINNRGDIVGLYQGNDLKVHGFFRDRSGVVLTLDSTEPEALDTYLIGINNLGQIVGFYGSEDPPYGWYTTHGLFRDQQGSCTTIDYPSAQEAVLSAINDLGQIAGSAWNGTQQIGFIRDKNGEFTDIAFPSAVRTEVLINNRGRILGNYYYFDNSRDPWFQDPTLEPHSFAIDRNGNFLTIDPPQAVNSVVSGINNAGMIAGTYRNDEGRFLGYIARLP